LKIVSFNVNGLRSRFHQLQAVVDKHSPDIIALQETKVQDQDFPISAVQSLGYQAVWSGQKTHYGVAILSRLALARPQAGFQDDGPQAQRRFIAATLPLDNGQVLRILNGYFPQGENRAHPEKFPNKKRFFAGLLDHLASHEDASERLVVVGDMNVAPTDLDVGIGQDNAKRWLRAGKCSFLPEERDWLEQILAWGLIDTYRHLNGAGPSAFSWFDYRSRGFERTPRRGLRIDLILATTPLLNCCVAAGIDYDIRGMDRPSDHAPVWAEFDL
jgi:exodeoxyribonuclease-3